MFSKAKNIDLENKRSLFKLINKHNTFCKRYKEIKKYTLKKGFIFKVQETAIDRPISIYYFKVNNQFNYYNNYNKQIQLDYYGNPSFFAVFNEFIDNDSIELIDKSFIHDYDFNIFL